MCYIYGAQYERTGLFCRVTEDCIAEGESRVARLEQEVKQLESQNNRTKGELGRTQAQMFAVEDRENELKRQVEANKEEELDNEDNFGNLVRRVALSWHHKHAGFSSKLLLLFDS